MKQNKNTLILVVVGVLLAVFIYLSTSYSQQVDGQEQLNEELSLTQQKLTVAQIDPATPQLDRMNEQLSRTMADIEAGKAKLSEQIKSVDISDQIMEIAGTSGVEVIGIISPGRSTDELEGVICSVLPLTVDVRGQIPNITAFVSALNNSLSTGVVQSVDITDSEEEGPSARIGLVLYTYESMPIKAKSTKR